MPSVVTILSVTLALFLALFASLSAYFVARWTGESRHRSVVWAACTYPVALGTIFLIYDQLRAGRPDEAARSLEALMATPS